MKRQPSGPECPSCGEPWLRGTNLPGRYRCLSLPAPLRAALGVPSLRRALDDRADVRHRQRDLPQLRRVDAPAHLRPLTSTGIPFSTALPDSGSTSDSSASTLLFTPACADATPIRTPSASWPQPCGIDTTPGMIVVGHLDRRLERAGGRAHARAAAVGEAEPLGVVRVHVERAALLALHERRQVVHPRVVRAQLAAADQDHAAVPLARRARARSRSTSATIGSGASSTLPDGVRSSPAAAARAGRGRRRAGSARARRASGPPGRRRSRRRRGPTRSRKSSIRSGPRRGSSSASSSAGSRPATGDASMPTSRWISVWMTMSSKAATSPFGPWPATIPASRMKISHSAGPSRSNTGGRVVRHVARGELVEREVVVRLLERLRRREDHVRVAGRLVHVDVDREHEVEPLDRALEPVRCSASRRAGCRRP